MKEDHAKQVLYLLSAAVAFFLITSCTKTPDVIGKWREIGKMSIIELQKDNTFKVVDDQGMSVKGKYTLYENGKVRFKILRQGASPDIVYGIISLRDEGMIMTFGEGKEVERYHKEDE